MEILKKIKKKITEHSLKKDSYSPNMVILFLIVSLFLIIILLGTPSQNPDLQIKNKYLSKIYLSCIKPLNDFSKEYKLNLIAPKIRSSFLKITKLEEHTEWDNFYYKQEAPTPKKSITKTTDGIILESKKIKTNIDEVKINIKKLERQLAFLNKTMTELKKIKDQPKTKNAENNAKENKNTIEEIIEKSKDNEKKETKTFEYNSSNPLRILMVGDSQMQSIAPALKRLVGNTSSIHIKEISVHSSGFIRGDYYNWQKKLHSIFQTEKYDVAVILLGMNDYQNFYNDAGKIMVKETKNWEEEYHNKITNILEILLSNTKKVYWLGMPIVRNKVYNADLMYIEKIQTQLLEKYSGFNLTRFSTANVAPGKGVPYTDIIKTVDGKTIKLMRDDGIHYTISGSTYIMNTFLNLIYQDWNIEPIKN